MELKIKELLDKIAEDPQDLESLAQAKKLADNYDNTLEQQEQRLSELLEQNRKLFKLVSVSDDKEETKQDPKQEKITFDDLVTMNE